MSVDPSELQIMNRVPGYTVLGMAVRTQWSLWRNHDLTDLDLITDVWVHRQAGRSECLTLVRKLQMVQSLVARHDASRNYRLFQKLLLSSTPLTGMDQNDLEFVLYARPKIYTCSILQVATSLSDEIR